jgi:hypothetical protein
MDEKLSSGMLSVTQEMKNEFQLRKPRLPQNWIDIYLDKYCGHLSPSELRKFYIHLLNVNRDNNPVAPSFSTLKNIDEILEELDK